jgi:N-acetylmuramic acid 6-phosphate etherase
MRTESVSPRFAGLDTWTGEEVLEALLAGQFAAIAAVRAARQAIDEAASAAALRLSRGGRLAYAGAGTSGRIAVQDGAELPPTFGWPQSRLVYLLAGGQAALLQAVEGAEDNRLDGEQLAQSLTPNDVLIGVAASGKTPFTVAALVAARRLGALTIGVANNAATPLLEQAHHPILLDSGSEVVAGSTRLAAGTAQKATLNLLSTRIMIGLGRVYQNRMVEVELTNQKLVHRGHQMLQELTGCTLEQAQVALERANRRVSLAVLLLRGQTLEDAQQLLSTHGHLRAALAALQLV